MMKKPTLILVAMALLSLFTVNLFAQSENKVQISITKNGEKLVDTSFSAENDAAISETIFNIAKSISEKERKYVILVQSDDDMDEGKEVENENYSQIHSQEPDFKVLMFFQSNGHKSIIKSMDKKEYSKLPNKIKQLSNEQFVPNNLLISTKNWKQFTLSYESLNPAKNCVVLYDKSGVELWKSEEQKSERIKSKITISKKGNYYILLQHANNSRLMKLKIK